MSIAAPPPWENPKKKILLEGHDGDVDDEGRILSIRNWEMFFRVCRIPDWIRADDGGYSIQQQRTKIKKKIRKKKMGGGSYLSNLHFSFLFLFCLVYHFRTHRTRASNMCLHGKEPEMVRGGPGVQFVAVAVSARIL